MSNKQKTALSATKTYEKAEAIELTKGETEKLSRAMLLKWLKAKKYEKLKGLQEQLVELAISDRDELRRRIVENTRKELAEQQELTKGQKQERAEKFADAIIGVADGIGNIKSVVENFERQANEEKMFHEYIGSVGGVLAVSNLRKIKENPRIKKLLSAEPGLSEELDEAIESGDYDNVKTVLMRIPAFKKHSDEIDMLLNVAMEEPQKLPGIMGLIGQGVNWIGGMSKKALEAFKSTNGLLKRKVYKPVAKKLGVEYSTLRNLSGLTFSQLIERNYIFQKYKNLLEEKLGRTDDKQEKKKLQKQLKFIEDTKKITEGVTQAKNEHGELIGKVYVKRLKTLQQEGKLSAEDVTRIIVELDLNSVKVDSFFPLIRYEDVKDKKQDSNIYLVAQIISRRKRMVQGAKLLGFDVSVRAAHGISGMQRLFDNNLRNFKRTFKEFPRGKNLTLMFEDLSRKASQYHVSSEAVSRSGRSRAYLADMKGYDEIMRMYYEASHHASRVLSAEAQRVVNVGKELDVLLKNGGGNLGNIPKSITDVLYEGGKVPKSISVDALRKAYTEKLIDVRVARDTAKQSFASLSGKIREDVMGKFENRWAKGADIADLKKTLLGETAEIKKFVAPRERMLHKLKTFGLPMIALGIPVIDVVRGKARYQDIKWDLFDTAIGFVPIAGTINDLKQMWGGKTTSGRTLSTRDRVMSGVFGFIGAVSDAAWVLGGLGGVMRAGIGSLRSARKIAKVGELSKSVRAIKEAEGVTYLQRIGMRIGGVFSGLSGAKRMEYAAESVAKIHAYNYLKIQRELKSLKGFDSVDDVKTAEKFAKSLEGTKHADSAVQYLEMMKHTNGIDYYRSLTRSFGFTENVPHFLGARMKFKEAINSIRLNKKFLKGSGRAERLSEMEHTADVYQAYKVEKAKALEVYKNALADGAKEKVVQKAIKNLKQVELKLVSGAKEYARVQEEVFATAERISRTHLLVSKAAKYFTYGGFAMGGYFMLTGGAPSVAGIEKYGGSAVKVAGATLGFVGRHVTHIHGYQPPVEDLIDEAIKNRQLSKEFAKRIKKLEDGRDPKKKEKIYALCAGYWSSSAVRSWVYSHKDKLDVKKIIDKAKKLFIPNRGRLKRVAGRVKETLGGGRSSV